MLAVATYRAGSVAPLPEAVVVEPGEEQQAAEVDLGETQTRGQPWWCGWQGKPITSTTTQDLAGKTQVSRPGWQLSPPVVAHGSHDATDVLIQTLQADGAGGLQHSGSREARVGIGGGGRVTKPPLQEPPEASIEQAPWAPPCIPTRKQQCNIAWLQQQQ